MWQSYFLDGGTSVNQGDLWYTRKTMEQWRNFFEVAVPQRLSGSPSAAHHVHKKTSWFKVFIEIFRWLTRQKCNMLVRWKLTQNVTISKQKNIMPKVKPNILVWVCCTFLGTWRIHDNWRIFTRKSWWRMFDQQVLWLEIKSYLGFTEEQ